LAAKGNVLGRPVLKEGEGTKPTEEGEKDPPRKRGRKQQQGNSTQDRILPRLQSREKELETSEEPTPRNTRKLACGGKKKESQHQVQTPTVNKGHQARC
jgi:hypothetical protein